MHTPSRLACALAFLALVASTLTRADPFEDAMAVRERGDISAAFSQFRQLASTGDAAAQFQLSLLYMHGKGIQPNAKESMFWLRQAAVHGNPQAQSNLGVAFNRGRYLPQDIVKSYIWSSIAAASGDSVALTNRDVAARKLAPKQLELAKMLAKECQQRFSEIQKLPQCL